MKHIVIIAFIVLLGFFSVGIPLATLPSFVREILGFSDIWVGIVLGIQSLITLLTRHHSGMIADRQGPKVAVSRGITLAVVSGLITVVAINLSDILSLSAILLGRMVLGYSESLFITGALSWGVGLAGAKNAGRVMAWSGMAMYASLAISPPLSYVVFRHFSFSGAISLTILLPLLAGLISRLIPSSPVSSVPRIPFYKVIPLVWKQGTGLAFAAVSFAGIAGFSSLLFKQNGWEDAPWVMTVFGAAYIFARIFFAQTPDRFGGKKVALVSSAIAVFGQWMIWQANSPMLVLCGAAITGFGYSLVFPAFGVEAIRNIDGQYRGVALGAYIAFFDLALGVTGPLAGMVANWFGYSSVFVLGMFACTISFFLALSMKKVGEVK